ncbi:MAG: hypothetical protein P4L46_15315 [Fimbriimonas sp.]|nr:hypothetical protein [Fimbriimonas sp.]
MKKLALAIFVALIASIAVAQGPGGMRGGGQRMDPKARLEKMTKDLGLNASQSKKVGDLQTKMMDSMKKLRSAPGDFKSKFPQMKKIRDEFGAGMKKILTPAQFAKFDKMEKERMSRMRGMGGPGGRGPGGPGGRGPGGPPPGKGGA